MMIVYDLGASVMNGKLFLSSTFRKNCFNLDISKEYRRQGDLRITLSKYDSTNYTVLSPSSATIRPREGEVYGVLVWKQV